ncbi:MAG TPA: NUDIX domain-containing protein [Syntrophales bacterium]|nr:NUDIX domain-containing protein [Syntrophales bacterium]HOR32742.1 NUDIX domain-containing protein [Syntrophales bacterium]HOT49260.1 NUDIX domain-containing protein [Syntrophales bacterium]HQF76324.1 NUDIX domain-containing protein [Syntrophales bacterium]HQK49363.1 NUDIX domain-containing protein [Syntrophales bacterium]
MKKGKRRFCHSCGGPVSVKEEDGINRDFCPACSLVFYENPLPVVSAIVAEDRRVLLVKRGKSPYKGSWCLPTGFAEIGESIEEAALRELEEETGIKGRILALTDVQSYKSRFYGDLLFVSYEAEQTGGVLKPGSDTVEARYFPVDRLPRLAFPSNRDAMRSYIRSKSEYWSIVDSFRIALGKESPKNVRKNLLSDKLVEVIEKNAGSIARRWLKDVRDNPSTAGYRQLNPSRLLEEILGILSQFGKWMGGYYKDSDIRDYYTAFGRESRRNGVPLSHVLSALSLIKKHLWEFALSRGMWKRTLDIYMALELDRRIVIFFDKAVFYTSQGHEAAGDPAP